jgi:hypothetical protein
MLDIVDAIGAKTYCVTTSNACVARVQRSVVYTLTLRVLESLTREPIVPPAGLSLCTVWAVSTRLAAHIRARKRSNLEAILSGLLLSVSGQVSRCQEFVDKSLVLAYAIAEHSSMIALFGVSDTCW